ncbi:hypothetical protein ABVK25_001753 [Lepraria finkii]|uniref:C2H2-type domain-containing protein n=1 Tax=Lepraria finkii TaxID=1340010 RepID=A0ABR4BK69_9LECA
MPPPWATNPAPKTESAREARKSFYCDLCQKGYSRVNEFEAHEGSYDHQHKKRLKEMKQMSRDPRAADKARKAERRADEKSGAITIKPLSLASSDTKPSSGFKKGGFKNAFGSVDDEEKDEKRGLKAEVKIEGFNVREQEAESESDDDYDRYDPRRPTGCGEGCPGRV